MRWFWIDRYLEFESGRYAVAVKNVSLAEEHLHDHFPGAPTMPNSLIVEGMAQTGGLLVGEANQFQKRVVLAKVSRAKFHFTALPGDTLTYRTQIEEIKTDGAMVTATCHVGDRLQAEAEIFFAHLSDEKQQSDLFDPAVLLAWLRVLRVFEVGHARDGSPLQIPPALAPFDSHDPKMLTGV
jgi:3-hydroxyacyl-[acyl-carrier-protein] dehydratase